MPTVFNPFNIAPVDNTKGQAKGKKGTSILGLSPAEFAAIMGQFGAAISPPNTFQQRLGQVAAGMGQSQLFNQLLTKLLAGQDQGENAANF